VFVGAGRGAGLYWEEAAAGWRLLVEALLDDARRLGVRLAIEPVSQLRVDLGFLHSFADALDFVDGISSTWLGVVLELNNAWIERGLYANIRQRRDRIAIVQISDFAPGTMAPSERVLIRDRGHP